MSDHADRLRQLIEKLQALPDSPGKDEAITHASDLHADLAASAVAPTEAPQSA